MFLDVMQNVMDGTQIQTLILVFNIHLILQASIYKALYIHFI